MYTILKSPSLVLSRMLCFLLPLSFLHSPAQQANGPRYDLPVADGPVNTMVVTNGIAYLGGSFKYLGQESGNGVVLDISTAARDKDFPVVNGTIYTAVPDATGGWYIGGSFTTVDGLPRAGVAHIRGDKTVDPAWNPG